MSKSIVFMGTPGFAKYQLEYLYNKGIDIKAVVTMPDKKMGRGMKVGESEVKQFAVANNLPVLQPEKLKEESFVNQLKGLQADLFVVVAFRMLPKVVWSMPQLGTINLHASLLPQYRGAAPINWAIINGENKSGVTTFLIDEEIDTGKILDKREVAISPTDTAGVLHDNLMTTGAELLHQTVVKLFEGTATALPQEDFINGQSLKHAPKIFKDDCKVDLSQPAQAAFNLIRGLSPYPGAFVPFLMNDKPSPVKIFKCEPVSIADGKPGEWITDGKTFAHLVCGNNTALNIDEMQLPGKKRMDIRSILAGNNLQSLIYAG